MEATAIVFLTLFVLFGILSSLEAALFSFGPVALFCKTTGLFSIETPFNFLMFESKYKADGINKPNKRLAATDHQKIAFFFFLGSSSFSSI